MASWEAIRAMRWWRSRLGSRSGQNAGWLVSVRTRICLRVTTLIHESSTVKASVEDSVDGKWFSLAWYAYRTGPIEIYDVRLPLNPLDSN